MRRRVKFCAIIFLFFPSLVLGQAFEDIPINQQVGAVPQNWNILEGTAKINTFDGTPVIDLDNNSIITPKLNSEDYLTNNFSIKFKAYFNEVLKSVNYQNYEIRLWPGDGNVTVPSSTGDGYYGPISIRRHGIKMNERIGSSNVIKHESSEQSLKDKDGVWRDISLIYNNGSLKVLIDNFEALNINQFNYTPTMISIGTKNNEYSADFERNIKNVTISGIEAEITYDNEHSEEEGPNTDDPLNGNYAYTLPEEDGLPNQILQTNGQGIVSWVDDIPVSESNSDVFDETKSDLSLNDLVDAKNNNSSLYIGKNAGQNDSNNIGNIGIGSNSLNANISGDRNIALGEASLWKNKIGSFNIAIGSQSMANNSEGEKNLGIGYQSLLSNANGDDNIAIGTQSMKSNISGKRNLTIGTLALSSNTIGNGNVVIGFRTMENNTTGDQNVTIGNQVLLFNTSGRANTAIGYQSMYENTVGYGNTAVGHLSLYNNKLARNNTAVGRESLAQNVSGNNNTAIGSLALTSITTGSNNTGIGYNAQVPVATASNQIRIGNTEIHYAGIQVPWHVTSDKTWKENIRNLPYGLNALMQLQPVDYVRKNNDNKKREMGFIAQDVEQVLTDIGYTDQGFLTKDDEGKLSLRYNDLIALLTKAIQEQQAIIEGQNTKIDELSGHLSTNMDVMSQLQKRLSQIEASLNTDQQ